MAASNAVLVSVLVLYVLGSTFVIYFCAIADPNTSRMSYFLTVDLPDRVWKMLSKGLDAKSLNVLSILADRALVVVYLGVVLGSWSVIFWYIYPWVSVSSHVSNYHLVIGVFVFAACLTSWRLASTSNPGIITAESYQRFNHYPFDNLLFVSNQACKSTNLLRIARSKFDRLKYHENVPRYDHFCGWVHNTIGEENYRWFLLFLFIHVIMCLYGATACYWLFMGDIEDQGLLQNEFFDRITGETFKASYFLILQYYFARRMPECAVFTIMACMTIALGAFLGYHIYITNQNMTTNEHGKWQDVHEWYKKKKRAYDQAVKKGLVMPDADKSKGGESVPIPADKDVTCTPSLSAPAPAPKKDDAEYFDPGPVPKNQYDRGFVENWKEVIFPLSLRDSAERQSYTLPEPDELVELQSQQLKQPSKVSRRPKNP